MMSLLRLLKDKQIELKFVIDERSASMIERHVEGIIVEQISEQIVNKYKKELLESVDISKLGDLIKERALKKLLEE